MSEKLNLEYNNFQTIVSSSFRKLRYEDDFYDVTLVSEDQQQVSAHKVVLSTCSEYFKNVLRKNKHSHPLLCLNDVNFSELKNILDYIYLGQLQILEEDLNQFLKIAQRFQIEGLMEAVDTQSEDESAKKAVMLNFWKSKISNNEEAKVDKKDNCDIIIPGNPGDCLEVNLETGHSTEDVDIVKVEEDEDVVLEEQIDIVEDSILEDQVEDNLEAQDDEEDILEDGFVLKTIDKKKIHFSSPNFENIEELNKKIEEMFERRSEGVVCTECGKVSKNKSHAREHAEIHIEGLSFGCKYCDKTYKTRCTLRAHEPKCIQI